MQPRSSPPTCNVTNAPRGSSSDLRCGAPGGMKPVVRYSRKVARAMRSSSRLSFSSRPAVSVMITAPNRTSSHYRRPCAVLFVTAVVVDDLAVIERQRRQLVERVHGDVLGVVGGARRAGRAPDEHHGHRRAARIALGIGVGEELLGERDLERGLLARLA